MPFASSCLSTKPVSIKPIQFNNGEAPSCERGRKKERKGGNDRAERTNITLRNPRHSIQIIAALTIVVHPDLAVIVDVGDDAVHLERGFDEPC